MRNVFLILTGLIIGVAGAILVRGSLPPEKDTPEAKILSLENELRDTRLRLAKIDPSQARQREDTGGAISDGVRAALADLKAGRPVDMNVLFHATKPLLRDLSPLFDNMRRKEERRSMEHLAGEYARRYELNADQQQALQKWLQERAERNAALFKSVALSDSTRLEDIMQAGKFQRRDRDVDGFMEGQLKGDKLTEYRRDRLTERANQVTAEADSRVQRLTGIADLDTAQQDQVFSIMARSSPEFDPQMQIEGVTTDAAPGADRDAAVMAVLRPDQRERYDQWREERRQRASQEFLDIGLKMPDGWDALSGE